MKKTNNSYLTQQKFIHVLSKSLIGILSHYMCAPMPRIILAYHGIHPTHPSCVKPDGFLEQIKYVHRHFKIVSIGELIYPVAEKSSKTLLSITFDDAYTNVFEYALPVLLELDIPATIFVPTKYMGQKNEWDALLPNELMPIATAETLREACSMGISIGSHTRSHLRLKNLPPDILKDEVLHSKLELEDILSSHVTEFAYPYGGRNDYDRNAVTMIKNAGYRSALTSNHGRKNSLFNRYELNRMTVWPSDSMERFIAKLEGYYDWVAAKEIMAYYLRLATHHKGVLDSMEMLGCKCGHSNSTRTSASH